MTTGMWITAGFTASCAINFVRCAARGDEKTAALEFGAVSGILVVCAIRAVFG